VKFLVSEIRLDDTSIQIESFDTKKVNDLHQISMVFNVTSEQYHDIATLLYKGTFDVQVPENDLSFKGTITNYFTSVTNLYEKGQVGQYSVTLLEVEQ
jgi:hypothetical protein